MPTGNAPRVTRLYEEPRSDISRDGDLRREHQ